MNINNYLDQLPIEIIHEIFSYLTIERLTELYLQEDRNINLMLDSLNFWTQYFNGRNLEYVNKRTDFIAWMSEYYKCVFAKDASNYYINNLKTINDTLDKVIVFSYIDDFDVFLQLPLDISKIRFLELYNLVNCHYHNYVIKKSGNEYEILVAELSSYSTKNYKSIVSSHRLILTQKDVIIKFLYLLSYRNYDLEKHMETLQK